MGLAVVDAIFNPKASRGPSEFPGACNACQAPSSSLGSRVRRPRRASSRGAACLSKLFGRWWEPKSGQKA